jgi:glycosyltransferase involved in cell wall biosynthesis
MSLSIILTCFNEAPLIFESYTTLLEMMKESGIEYEFIISDDGSEPNVQSALTEYFEEIPVTMILSSLNEGRGAAITKGIRAAKQDYVCNIDTDLEIPGHTVLALYRAVLDQQADMVLAARVYKWDRYPMHSVRHLGSFGLRAFSAILLGLGMLDHQTGAKLFRREAVLNILDGVSNKRFFWDTEIVSEVVRDSQKVTQIPITVERRRGKSSSVRLVPDTLKYIKAVLSYKFGRRSRIRARNLT